MKTILSIGNFDGIHLGHRRLLLRMRELAAQNGLRSVVISYQQHPAYTLNKHAQPLLLMPARQKREHLLRLGINQVDLICFDQDFARISADHYLHDHLMPDYDPRIIVVGHDSHFGHLRRGDLRFLQTHQQKYDYQLEYIEPILHDGTPISSTMIRQLLQKSRLKVANTLLGSPYTLFGTVVRGRGLGASLGFPTANLELCDPHQLIPHSGIYLSRVKLQKKPIFGLTNIGCSPTLKSESRIGIETYLLDWDQDLYGQYLELELLHFLREEKMFESKEALITAMQADLKAARELIAGGFR